jgi:hypothetical protein
MRIKNEVGTKVSELGFRLAIFFGRGLFNCKLCTVSFRKRRKSVANLYTTRIDNMGLMPYRHPIVSVGEHSLSRSSVVCEGFD